MYYHFLLTKTLTTDLYRKEAVRRKIEQRQKTEFLSCHILQTARFVMVNMEYIQFRVQSARDMRETKEAENHSVAYLGIHFNIIQKREYIIIQYSCIYCIIQTFKLNLNLAKSNKRILEDNIDILLFRINTKSIFYDWRCTLNKDTTDDFSFAIWNGQKYTITLRSISFKPDADW